MPVENVTLAAEEQVWNPDSATVSQNPTGLLRADNLVPDENNRLTLRRGSTTLHTLTADDPTINSIYATEIGGDQYKFANVGNRVYMSDPEALTTMIETGYTFDGSGDVSFADDSYQVFFARGSTKKKFDGESVINWGLPTPTAAPTLTAAAFNATVIADYGASETTIAGTMTYPEGTHNADVTGYDGTSSGATSMTPIKRSGRASVCKIFTTTQDFSILNEQSQADTDLFDLYCWLEEPRKVDKITIMFGLNDSDGGKDPFITDYYSFEFKVKDQITVDVKDSGSTGAAAYGKSVDKIQSVLDPLDVTKIKTPAQVQQALQRLGRFAGPRSRERVDAQQASPAWTHFSVTRGQFNRTGGTPAKDWSTVTAFKVVYTALQGSEEKIYLDQASWFGGGDRALTGTYRGCYRFVKDTGNYIELGPPSPISEPVTVTQGNVSFTIPAAGVAEADYANQIWVYLYGGFLDTFYRFAITGSSANAQALRIEEFTTPDAGGTVNPSPPPTYTAPLDDATQRGAMAEIQFGLPGGDTAGDASITVALRKGELDALIDNETLEPGVVGPPDDILAVAGPWLNRMFCLTSEGFLYPSSDTSPSTFSVWWVRDLRRYGTPLWMVKTNGGILCGFTKDVVRITGSGELSADKAFIDLWGQPMGVGQPPCDNAVYTDGNTVVYRSVDGLVTLNGASASYLPVNNTSMLWRGFDRHGVSAINVQTGRFRMAYDNGIIYVVVPEGEQTVGNAIYRFYTQRNEWCRTTYPHFVSSLYRNPDGTLLAGTTAGKLIQLEDGTSDDGANISVYWLTPIMDAGYPLSRKHAFDLQIYGDTGGDTGTMEWMIEGSANVHGSTTFALPGDTVWRENIDGTMDPWAKAQFRITGSFSRFHLHHINLCFHKHPQMVMALNTGYLLPSGAGDVAWIQEIELDCIAQVDIDADIYVDDELYTTIPITVQPGVHTVYRFQVPQGTKGRRPHILFKSTGHSGVGNVGFEPYSVRIRQRSSGNQIEAEYIPIYPVGQDD